MSGEALKKSGGSGALGPSAISKRSLLHGMRTITTAGDVGKPTA
jgi:hypothetical protein